MNQSERRRAIEIQHLSTRQSVTIPKLASIFSVAENTIKSDLLFLENQGVALCENPDGKPQRWFAVRSKDDLEMTLEMACAIKRIEKTARLLLPKALFYEVECLFNAANKAYLGKQKANHQSKVIRYDNSVSGIDLMKHLHREQITADALEEIKSAIYTASMLRIEVDECEEVLTDVSLVEVDEQLFLEGSMCEIGGKPQRFNTRYVSTAEVIERPRFRALRSKAA